MPTYAYAANNPVGRTDPTGLYSYGVACDDPRAGEGGFRSYDTKRHDQCADCADVQAKVSAYCAGLSTWNGDPQPLLSIAGANGQPQRLTPSPANCDCAKKLAAEVCAGVSPGKCPEDPAKGGKRGFHLACE